MMSRAEEPDLDGQGLWRCAKPRKGRPEVPCRTIVARPNGKSITIRCRNCGSDHTFVIQDNEIVPHIS